MTSSGYIPLNVCPVDPLLIYNNLPPNWLIALPKSIYFLGNKSRISSESTGKLYLFVLLKSIRASKLFLSLKDLVLKIFWILCILSGIKLKSNLDNDWFSILLESMCLSSGGQFKFVFKLFCFWNCFTVVVFSAYIY